MIGLEASRVGGSDLRVALARNSAAVGRRPVRAAAGSSSGRLGRPPAPGAQTAGVRQPLGLAPRAKKKNLDILAREAREEKFRAKTCKKREIYEFPKPTATLFVFSTFSKSAKYCRPLRAKRAEEKFGARSAQKKNLATPPARWGVNARCPSRWSPSSGGINPPPCLV